MRRAHPEDTLVDEIGQVVGDAQDLEDVVPAPGSDRGIPGDRLVIGELTDTIQAQVGDFLTW